MASSSYPHPVIAREGWPFLGLALAAALALSWWAPWWIAAIGWLATIFVAQFFRDPPRRVPREPKAVLSPADGRVVRVERARDPYLERDALKISVFMNVFNVHSNRSPIDGVVKDKWYHPGTFINASLDKASLDNERCALRLQTAAGADVTCVQVAGLIARRILCYADKGQSLSRGERYGFIRFGSRVDVYVPTDATPKVAPGDMAYATETVIAELAR